MIDSLISSIQHTKTPLVVGIDPHIDLIPPAYIAQCDATQYPDKRRFLADVVYRYNETVLNAIAGRVPAVKFQVAFFEPFGDLGYTILQKNMKQASALGLKVILDAKRGDIGSTAQGYCNAYFYNESLGESAFLEADFLTVNPFMGMDTLAPFMQACDTHGKGVFVLLKTSNPGSSDLQDLVLADGTKLHVHLAHQLQQLAETSRRGRDYSCLGVVVGATYPEEAALLRDIMPHSFFLVPGIGTQQGDISQLHHFYNADGMGAIFNVSRGVMFHQIEAEDVAGSIVRNVHTYNTLLAEVAP